MAELLTSKELKEKILEEQKQRKKLKTLKDLKGINEYRHQGFCHYCSGKMFCINCDLRQEAVKLIKDRISVRDEGVGIALASTNERMDGNNARFVWNCIIEEYKNFFNIKEEDLK